MEGSPQNQGLVLPTPKERWLLNIYISLLKLTGLLLSLTIWKFVLRGVLQSY